ncbi:MAG TPA: hypothetical protein DEG71_09850 [Clostridiales bacterium]|nr:hypothetical protein [Clostridiales bacterium]
MKNKLFVTLSALVLFVLSTFTYAEGTIEITKLSTSKGKLQIMTSFSDFALYNCNESQRLNITIYNVGETVYYGFGTIINGSGVARTDVTYRIKNPSGVVVKSGTLTNSGAGYISTYAKAVAGPSAVVGASGYGALSFVPEVTGNYYIEFNYNTATGDRRTFDFFDITVVNATNQAIKGRVWSKAWQLSVGNYTNQFDGSFFVYADDGIITSLDFNKIQPYVFTVSANATGCFNSGNPYTDRMSTSGLHTYPQYKIFLNEPDPNCFPVGNFGNIVAPATFSGCAPKDFCINITVDKAGRVEIMLDLNGIDGYQPYTEDVFILQAVVAGVNCISWNGLDGLGNPLAVGTDVKSRISFLNGLTHLPLYDVEQHINGYKVKIVKPITPDSIPTLFWDDTRVGGGTELNGCNATVSGCHTWIGDGSSGIGNVNTVNTWWYASNNKNNIITNFTYITVDAGADQTICEGSSTTIMATGAEHYSWNTGDTTASVAVNPTINTTYTVTGTKSGMTITNEVVVFVNPLPVANSGSDVIIYNGDSTQLNYTGTSGDSIKWSNNIESFTQWVKPTITTTYTMTIYSNGCSDSDNLVVTVYSFDCAKTTNLFVNNISPVTVKLNWDNDVYATSYMLRWRIKAGPGSWMYYNATAGQNYVTIGNLTASTTYEWQMRKFCNNGLYSDFTDLSGSEFTTSIISACNQATPNSITNIKTNQVTLNWATVVNNNGYMVRWRVKSPQGAWVYYNATSGENTCDATGLKANTSYEWQMRTFCENNTISAFTELAQFVTLPSCADITNLSQIVDTTVAILKWNPVNGADHYLLRWRVANGLWKYININNQIGYQQIGCFICNQADKLLPNTTYEWQIRAFCNSEGTMYSNFSAIQQFETLENKNNKESNTDKFSVLNSQFSINIYPNPANDILNITTTASNAKNLTVDIYDIYGKLIMKEQLIDNLQLDIKHLESGIYFIKIENQTLKFIKQ